MEIKCQMPGCNELSTRIHKIDGIFCGIYLEEVTLSSCNRHSEDEINNVLQKIGEETAESQQECNPFLKILQKRD